MGEPVVTASPAICAPRVSGDMRKGGDLEVGEPMSMTVRYNCATGGSTVITVRVPLDDQTLEAVTWSFRKNNGPSAAIQQAIDSDGDWTAGEVMWLLVFILAVALLAYVGKSTVGGGNGYSRVSTYDDTEMGK